MHRIAAEPLDVLRTRTSEKWRHYDADVLPLPVAEMDYPLAEPIATALHAAIDRSDTGYAAGSRPVAEAFAPFAAERFGWEVDPARITCTGDVAMGLVEVLRQVTGPGDPVIVTPPIYPPFFDIVTEASARVVEVPMRGGIDEGWSLDLDGIDAAFAAGAKAMLLCNPHNPIGRVPERDELAALAEIAARHGVTVVSDEVHGPLSQPGTVYTPFLTVSDAAREHGVTVTAASKAFNLAGLKAAMVVTASDRGDAVRRAFPYEVEWRMSQFGSIASVAAFRDGGHWLDGVLASLDDNRRLLAELLADELPGVRYRIPDATYLAWLDLSVLGWGDDPAAVALERARVALGIGTMFGKDVGRGHVRLNFACTPEVLGEAIARLADAAESTRR
ncbi:aminotransferase class I/II-fold pyridoxal phosphate-dependent enzyme [Agromyces sp. H3Y2-19a]|jgi:cystathionine beta-lyase|uniref:MalY/PatB family protein n=1 Tax=Agromyces chromiiresistens TaxID=3030835 RepID=UPI0023B8B68C|nr:aminotransferase class I/II-fold pyridoxal phosphate-dependent enzyme [Agromyces chromiiresistens]MDF0512665.1 aminotransferase class I/II-fold pyridoxal phosphate-dependent enzyme [Agromyces chromiiresistens]